MNVHEVLCKARNLIDREGWSPDGLSEGAYCVVQATFTASDGEVRAWSAADRVLERLLGVGDAASWNDEPGRSKKEVLAVFDKAIAATAPEPYVHLEVPEEVAV